MQVCNLGLSLEYWDNTAPIPPVEAYTSTRKGRWGSGCARVGALQKTSFRCLKFLGPQVISKEDFGLSLNIEVSAAE